MAPKKDVEESEAAVAEKKDVITPVDEKKEAILTKSDG